MSKENKLEVTGEIIDCLPACKYKVILSDWTGLVVNASLSWKMKQKKIKIILWDSVQVELNEYDMWIGRIVYRNKI